MGALRPFALSWNSREAQIDETKVVEFVERIHTRASLALRSFDWPSYWVWSITFTTSFTIVDAQKTMSRRAEAAAPRKRPNCPNCPH
jgi:hypothetical protein